MEKLKELFKFIFVFVLMIFSTFIVKNFLQLFGIMYTPDNYFLYTIYDFVGSLIVIIPLIIIHRKTLKEDFKKITSSKKNIVKFIAMILAGYLCVIGLEIFLGIFERLLFAIFNMQVEIADNQQKLEKIIHAAPYLMVISTCLFAPIEEELLFRGSIRRTIKNKGVFIAVSGLFFGLLHITDNYISLVLFIVACFVLSTIIESKNTKSKKLWLSVITVAISIALFAIMMTLVHGNLFNYFYSIDPKELINGITYVALGCYLASVYAKTENIYYSIGIHMITNTLATIMLLT